MIIDTHLHLGPIPGYFNYDISLDGILRLMDSLGITHAVNIHTAGLIYGDLEKGIQESIKAYEASNRRILSYHTFDPNIPEKSLDAIKSCQDSRIFRGVKIHPSFHGVPADSEKYAAIWEYAQQNDILLISHTWDISPTNPTQKLSFPPLFEKYLAKYPRVRIIFGHSGGRYKGIQEAIRLGKKYPNVYFDTAGDIYANHFIETLVAEIGSQRVLFGSDCSMMDQRTMLGVVLGAKLSLQEKEDILYRNAARMLEIEPGEPSSLTDGLAEQATRYHRDRQQLGFFDINCWWDATHFKTFHRIESFDQLKQELRACGITKAVISNAECIKYDPLAGNESTARLIAGDEALYGCMLLTPEMTFRKEGMQGYIDQKIDQRFIAARLFPKKMNHSMKKWLVGDILEHLQTRKIPLILWHNEVSWDLVDELCTEYPHLPVIIEGNDVKLLYHSRNYLALLKRHRNFYIETHNLVLYSEMDTIVNNIGDENLLFGTYFPYNAPDVSMLPILAGMMEEKSKHKIACGNLQRLIDQIKGKS